MGRKLWSLGYLGKTPRSRFCKDAENLPEAEEGRRHPGAGLGSVSPLPSGMGSVSQRLLEDSTALGPQASASLGWVLERSPCLSWRQGLSPLAWEALT